MSEEARHPERFDETGRRKIRVWHNNGNPMRYSKSREERKAATKAAKKARKQAK